MAAEEGSDGECSPMRIDKRIMYSEVESMQGELINLAARQKAPQAYCTISRGRTLVDEPARGSKTNLAGSQLSQPSTCTQCLSLVIICLTSASVRSAMPTILSCFPASEAAFALLPQSGPLKEPKYA
eukprot:CAMPEP_0115384782 /NCGR_PEP_ID=MMETSP0271-20121206/7287_1 /TAXON_ID=71861 /ORGANISM="Scrippsiella trochoidea, Strain CCMP3099" /LENGTH=126 /DNA_ID=CAMNT_0002808151 /DNA_START=172 /DNA_END=552 /DNA_ORIENTATION=+